MGEKFELIVGERRWRATQLLKKDTIDAVIIDADEKTSAVLSIVENVQREDLNSMEEAESLLLERQLSESLGAKINIKHSKSGGVISIKYSTMNELQGIIEKIRNTNKK